jgi:hypothetical protein
MSIPATGDPALVAITCTRRGVRCGRVVACSADRDTPEEPGIAIEIRQTKRTIVYRAVVRRAGTGPEKVSKTFRTKAAAEAWERAMLQAAQPGELPPEPLDTRA